jgi:hypothetical protein
MVPSKKGLSRRFWIEVGLSSLTGVLLVVTLFWHDWLEAFGFDPDHHNGTVEWLVVAVLGVATFVLALLARIEWRRAALANS